MVNIICCDLILLINTSINIIYCQYVLQVNTVVIYISVTTQHYKLTILLFLSTFSIMAEGGKELNGKAVDGAKDWADTSHDELDDTLQLKIDLPSASDTDDNDDRDSKKLKKTNKDLIIVKLQKAWTTNDKLQKDIDTLTASNSDAQSEISRLRSRVQALMTERSSLVDELSKTSHQLDNQKAITQDLLDQIDNEEPDVAKSILLLMDKNRLALRAYLNDPRFEFTVCTIIDDLDDMVTLLNDEQGIQQIQSHDKVVIAVGQYDILEGHWNGRAVATKLLSIAETIVGMGVETTILGIPPTSAKQGQVLLCNTRLAKMPSISGIDFVPIDAVHEMDKDKAISDTSTLTPDAAKLIAKILLDNLHVTGVRLLEKKQPDQKPDQNKPDSAGTSGGAGASGGAGSSGGVPKIKPAKPQEPARPDPESEESEDDDSDSIIEETIYIRQGDVGKIIGLRGARIKALQAKTGATVFVEDFEKDGDTKSWAFIKGKPSCVKEAKAEIQRILKEKSQAPRGPTMGASPKPKKQKKGNK